MSVLLHTQTETGKIANSLQNFSKTRDMARVVWYLGASNVMAYNLQYREDATIDFKEWERCDESFDKLEDAIDAFYSLYYNAATNDGNTFYPTNIQADIDWFIEATKEDRNDRLADYNCD